MAALDAAHLGILLGSLLVLAGIMSSLVAMRFGAPLLLVFLIVGMLAGEAGPGGLKFDDVQPARARRIIPAVEQPTPRKGRGRTATALLSRSDRTTRG